MHDWELLFESKIERSGQGDDPAHDLSHFRRVVTTAKSLCELEGGDPAVVVPAAWLHDLINVPKNDPRRSQASRLSAEAATAFLREIGYPERHLAAIAHAIAGHSFSAGLPVDTLEAKIVQDADRLDGLGAIGIARCFTVAGLLKRPLYAPEDPFCEDREPDDALYTLDHFYRKLFKTAETLKTESGRAEGARRVAAMRRYLDDLAREI